MSRAPFPAEHPRIDTDAIIPHSDTKVPFGIPDLNFNLRRLRVVERIARLPRQSGKSHPATSNADLAVASTCTEKSVAISSSSVCPLFLARRVVQIAGDSHAFRDPLVKSCVHWSVYLDSISRFLLNVFSNHISPFVGSRASRRRPGRNRHPEVSGANCLKAAVNVPKSVLYGCGHS